MEPLSNIAPYTGWVYPNETLFEWSILIAVYPYLTGLVAGAFTVSSLYQVFGFQRLKPVAHLALLTSLCFMIFVPSPLLLHLGHPERAFEATLTPHWSSAMAMFGYIASFYVVLLLIEGWFAYRPFIVEQAQRRKCGPAAKQMPGRHRPTCSRRISQRVPTFTISSVLWLPALKRLDR